MHHGTQLGLTSGNATSARPQTEIERLNSRLCEAVGALYNLRNRINTIADYTVGLSPTPENPSSANIEPVSSNTQHFIVDLEKAIQACSTAISRLDNQGS